MNAVIAGIGELPQGRSPAASPLVLHEDLVRAACADAGVDLDGIDCLLTVSPRSDPYLIHAGGLAEYLRIAPPVTLTFEAGGGGPMAMVDYAARMIAAGTVGTALIVAADMPLGSVSRKSYVKALAEVGPVHPDVEVPFSPSVPSMFGLVARRHMEEFGTTDEHFAAVAVQERRSAQRHPNAHMRAPMTAEDHAASPMIATPLRRLDCAPVSDGGGAIVMTSRERAKGGGHPPVEVIGTGYATGHMHLSAAPSLTAFTAGRAFDAALAAAGITRDAIDVALVYDCYTIAMLVNLEDLGFAAKGRAGPGFLAGEFELDGRLPVNPHGGLLSHGHPARGGGFGNLVEAVIQLRGTAGERQVDGARVALAHGMGGVFATHAVQLLRAAA